MVTAFLRNRHLLILSIKVIMVAGISALVSLPRIEDPRIRNRYPLIVTRYPGATAERVEALVIEKLEDALREVSEIKLIESTSRARVSVIAVEFHDHVSEIATAFAKVRDKLGEVEDQLPIGASRPFVDDQRGAEAFTLIFGLTWEPDTPASLGLVNRMAEELTDRLRNVPGTEFVRIFGSPEEEITVTVDPDELSALGLTTHDIAERIRAADAKVPAGTLRGESMDLILEVTGQLDSVRRVTSVPIREGVAGNLLRVGDAAEIRRTRQDPPRQISLVDGKRGVFVAARMRPDRRVDLWAETARGVVESFERDFTGAGRRLSVACVFEQSRYTSERLSGLSWNLAAGAGVIVLVVLSMMGWRSSVVVCLALPLDSAATLFGLAIFGVPLHQMSIFGLIIALGLLIDKAIVVVDEVTPEWTREGDESRPSLNR